MQIDVEDTRIETGESYRIAATISRLGIGSNHAQIFELAQRFVEPGGFNEIGNRGVTYSFEKNDLDIMYTNGDANDVGISFTPTQESSIANRIAGALDAIEDYIVLVEAGIMARPGGLRGHTNDQMAAFATRFGFEIDHSQSEPGNRLVFATFDSLKEAILSISPERKQKLRARAVMYPEANSDDEVELSVYTVEWVN